MSRPTGIDVILVEEIENGRDPLNQPIYEEKETVVSNVLVSPSTTDEITDTTNLYGKKAIYTLAIPKGDNHDWSNKKVKFFNKTFRTFGEPIQGIDVLIPLQWNMKVSVEIYE